MAAVPEDEAGTPVDDKAARWFETPDDKDARNARMASKIKRLQARILANCSWVDHRQACSLLGLSVSDQSDSVELKPLGQVLSVAVDGCPVYPLFQFDMEEHGVFPAMGELLSARPANWSEYRLLHWLTTFHLDLGCTPAEALSSAGGSIIAAFGREIQMPSHG